MTEWKEFRDVVFRMEAERGQPVLGTLWSLGLFEVELRAGESVVLVASTERPDVLDTLSPDDAFAAEQERRTRLIAAAHPAARRGPAAELVIAADQFIIAPASRRRDLSLAHASGREPRSVIAGYHWFTDWGRDTMISLEGLALITGRFAEARWILESFANHIRDGLIPNLFPEGDEQGRYHTADATLWFFYAIDRYLQATGDDSLLPFLLPKLLDIAEHHLRGTRFGIGVDPSDGLLQQGAAGYQLTWMDAKYKDWVVTPRRGKAVEINALWYHALRLLEEWTEQLGESQRSRQFGQHAARARDSFQHRFWNEAAGQLYDVIGCNDVPDAACRPNQIFAVSLRHAVLDENRWESVVNAVAAQLLTPYGLRSLAPSHPQYRRTYHGDLEQRDSAYHQGTVWAWLIGHFVDAWLKVHPGERTAARQLIAAFEGHLGQACIGSISEIFDAEAPYAPRGCVAQAWSVAEVLRAWVLTDSLAHESGAPLAAAGRVSGK
jgi:predicted glycogen debranching enzyme